MAVEAIFGGHKVGRTSLNITSPSPASRLLCATYFVRIALLPCALYVSATEKTTTKRRFIKLQEYSKSFKRLYKFHP